MGIFDKIKEVISDHPDQVNQGIDKAGDLLDEKTGGKYAEHVDQGQEFLKGQTGHLGAPENRPEANPEVAHEGNAEPLR